MPHRRLASLLATAALGGTLAAAVPCVPGCGSPPVQPPPDVGGVARPTEAELANGASAATTAESPRPDPKSSSRVLAYVNGEVVSYRDVYLRVGPDFARVVEDPAQRARIERRELIGIIRDRLLHQAAVDEGIDVDRDELDKERARRVRELAQSGGTLDAYLAERGMTRREYDESLRRDLRSQRYLRAKVGLGGEGAVRVRAGTDTWVAPGDIRKYYDRHLERFHEPATARVRRLTVTADLNAEDREAATRAARERAEAFRGRLAGGEDFVPIFREANPDVPDPMDGLVEIRTRGKLAQWIEEFAFEQPRGTISEVLQVPAGGASFHVLYSEGVSAERQRPFEEAQREIERQLTQQRRAIASYEVELSLLEEAVVRPADLAGELREELSVARRRIAAEAGL